MKIPADPKRGEDILPWARLVNRCLRAGRITSVSGPARFQESPNGGTLIIESETRRKTGAAGGSALEPWQPIFSTTGSGESTVYKVRIHLGTVNGVPAANWNTVHTLSMAEDAFHFVVATVTTASGKVTNVTISVDASAPSEDSLAKNTPPTTFKIVLHAIGRTEARTIIRNNLNAYAAEVFREGKSAPAVGAEPFERWWRWNIETV